MSKKYKLINEAWQIYGTIKPNDVFDRSELGLDIIPVSPLWDGLAPIYVYFESEDILEYQGTAIYHNGRWAKKVTPEAVNLQEERSVNIYYLLAFIIGSLIALLALLQMYV
jgi:hypothetical protein